MASANVVNVVLASLIASAMVLSNLLSIMGSAEFQCLAFSIIGLYKKNHNSRVSRSDVSYRHGAYLLLSESCVPSP